MKERASVINRNLQKHWFMHEMVHVWQYQLGYPVMTRGAIRLGLDYEYEFGEASTLGDFNMEAQGDILADYFAIAILNNPGLVINSSKYSLEKYKKVIKGFLENPADKKNLP